MRVYFEVTSSMTLQVSTLVVPMFFPRRYHGLLSQAFEPYRMFVAWQSTLRDTEAPGVNAYNTSRLSYEAGVFVNSAV